MSCPLVQYKWSQNMFFGNNTARGVTPSIQSYCDLTSSGEKGQSKWYRAKVTSSTILRVCNICVKVKSAPTRHGKALSEAATMGAKTFWTSLFSMNSGRGAAQARVLCSNIMSTRNCLQILFLRISDVCRHKTGFSLLDYIIVLPLESSAQRIRL